MDQLHTKLHIDGLSFDLDQASGVMSKYLKSKWVL